MKEGEINGVDVPIFNWDFVDSETVGMIVSKPLGGGVSGSGYLAEIRFKVVGEAGDKSVLDISDGVIANKEAGNSGCFLMNLEVQDREEHYTNCPIFRLSKNTTTNLITDSIMPISMGITHQDSLITRNITPPTDSPIRGGNHKGQCRTIVKG